MRVCNTGRVGWGQHPWGCPYPCALFRPRHPSCIWHHKGWHSSVLLHWVSNARTLLGPGTGGSLLPAMKSAVGGGVVCFTGTTAGSLRADPLRLCLFHSWDALPAGVRSIPHCSLRHNWQTHPAGLSARTVRQNGVGHQKACCRDPPDYPAGNIFLWSAPTTDTGYFFLGGVSASSWVPC